MSIDNTIKTNILNELDWDDRVDASRIGVTVEDGAVTLSGETLTFPQKFQAVELCKAVHGVKAVADEISVNLHDSSQLSDTEIAKHIAHVLTWNVSIPEDSVQASVRNGFVTLTGNLEWQPLRAKVEKQVGHVRGVRGIDNKIEILNTVTPGNVKQQIDRALRRNAELESSHVNVVVEGDTVILSGNVKAFYERELVELSAWRAPGVKKVVDKITVG